MTSQDKAQILIMYTSAPGAAMGTFLESWTWSVYDEDYFNIAAQLVAINNGWA